jgi:hypothetical protein
MHLLKLTYVAFTYCSRSGGVLHCPEIGATLELFFFFLEHHDNLGHRPCTDVLHILVDS